MIRYSGVSKEIYYYIGEDVVNASNTSVWWQEFINDWVAEHLYSIMAKKKYSGSNVGKNTQMSSFLLGVINREFNGDVKKFIGSYFSNQLCHLEMEYTDKERE